LIIGSGIAGPVTAMALQKAGIDATVYEAYPTSAVGIGGMLTLAPNGLDALSIVGADDAVRGVGLPMTRMVIADGTGRHMGAFPALAGVAAPRAMARADLNRALRDQAVARGIRIEGGKRLIAVDETPTAITAQFDDGSTASADILIGADGTHSTTRTLIDPDAAPPGHVPLLNFGAIADIAVRAEPETTYFIFGKRGFLGYWAQPDGRTAWFSNLPHAEPMSLTQARQHPASHWLELLGEAYADDTPGRDLLRSTQAESLTAFGSIEILMSVQHWHRGRMVLVGDSVHAPSPSSGQGASLAIESAVQLARCLRDIPHPPTAFSAYEQLRRPRVEKVAARAARTNNSKALGPVALGMMRLLMPLATRTLLTPERTLGLEQRYRIDWDSPEMLSAGDRRSAR
jgi:2-polyprenyl-6-methoxyphenol hydroxylase-like FAD-dependent oxidoreductase